MNVLTKAKKILKKLNECGYEAYIVGGYVRDMLLNIDSNDIDITTNALPNEIEKVFNVSRNGIDYNSVTIIDGSDSFEITTFRKDVLYKDHRHPIVELVDNIDEDLKRRDFTINALAMDYNNNIIDNYEGIKDLENKIIRTIDDPNKRFDEDALRILRGFYLVSKLEFSFDSKTYSAIKKNAYLLDNLSTFRIISEMKKIVSNNKTNNVFKLIKETECIYHLKSLSKGINYLLDNNEIIRSKTLFFSLCFYLNGEYDESYEFTKQEKRKIKEVIALSMKNIDKYDIINYEYEIVSYANELRRILKQDYITDFNNLYDNLAIHSIKDISITAIELATELNKEPGEWINFYFIEIAKAIIDKKINNNRTEIINYAKKEVFIWKK
ncbi:MAG: CCA tRNA nucleotidyltransferase [Anaeroplasmataceae bacterium]